jgi:uncharacterized protein (DUF305 family)
MNPHGIGFMTLCMIAAGFLSTMNNWADSWSDISWSVNDIYMTGLMTGWMIFFMGLFSANTQWMMIGIVAAAVFIVLIRTQAFVSESQYLRGMIPHHSMAVFMSKRLAEKPNGIPEFLQKIVGTQREEIEFMRGKLL